MKKSDLTYLIKNAYAVEPSERKTAFLFSHPMRSLHYQQIICMQFQYMGVQLAVIFGCVLAFLLGAAANVGENLAKLVAAFVPLTALAAMTGFGRSARCGMEELEISSRFSLRMLRIVRLSIIGMAGLFVMLAVSLTIRMLTGAEFLFSFAFATVPYLLTTFLCMLLIRRWHSPKNIYGCTVIAASVSAMMLGSIKLLPLCSVLLFSALPVLILLTAAEAYKFINESEKMQWNLC